MNGRILFYALLALMWGVLAVAIFVGVHERWLGVADEWKRYLAMGLCGLMFLWNLVRIYALRQAQRARAAQHEPSPF
jgi:hypothetical protein